MKIKSTNILLLCHLFFSLFIPVSARWRFFGGGGGRYTGGGSSNGEGVSNLTAIAIWLTLGITVLVMMYVIYRHAKRKRKWNQRFRQKVETAPEAILASNAPRQVGQPTSGTYHAKYNKSVRVRREKEKELKLNFEPDGTCWKISGSADSCVGRAMIQKGKVSNTGDAYWIEEIRENTMISMGRFDFENKTFQGEWQTRYGQVGEYEQFCLRMDDVEMARPM